MPGYIVEGLTLLAGKPNSENLGSSCMLPVTMRRGGYTLSEMHYESDILNCALEDNPRRLKRRMRNFLGFSPWPACLKVGMHDASPERRRRRCRCGNQYKSRPRASGWSLLTRSPRCVTQGRPRFEYEADYAAVSELKALADEKGVAIVLVHHVRKMAAEEITRHGFRHDWPHRCGG